MTIEITGPLRTVADGFRFTECPRWHDDMLYFCDMHDQSVYRIGANGAAERVIRLPANAGGIGWDGDGNLLAVSMGEGRVMRLRNGELEVYADLEASLPVGLNDMIVGPNGRCYVGRYFHLEGPYSAPLFFVDDNGTVHETEEELAVANGMVLTADGKRLIVAESGACRLAMFDIAEDGMPVNRRTFAQLPEHHYPDGICGDDQGGIWVTCTQGPGVIRVEEGGTITHVVPMPEGRFSYACVLGGEKGDTLYICTAGAFNVETHSAEGGASVEAIEVPFRRAGRP